MEELSFRRNDEDDDGGDGDSLLESDIAGSSVAVDDDDDGPRVAVDKEDSKVDPSLIWDMDADFRELRLEPATPI